MENFTVAATVLVLGGLVAALKSMEHSRSQMVPGLVR